MEQAIIAGVAHDRSEAKITVVGVPDKVGEAARIFEALATGEVNIDMVVQNISAAATGLTDISFTLPRADGQTAMGALARIQDEVGYDRLLYDDQIGKVSLIGAGMRSHPGVTAKFFSALAAAGVNNEMISTFTPASASAPKNRADTPGCDRMPAPMSDTLPMWSS